MKYRLRWRLGTHAMLSGLILHCGLTAALAQQNVEWKLTKPIQPLRMLKPEAALDVLDVSIGSLPGAALDKLKKRHPAAQTIDVTESNYAYLPPNGPYLAKISRMLRVAEGVSTPRFVGHIDFNSNTASGVDRAWFGFTSPSSGNRLVSIYRDTALKNAVDFPTEEQVIKKYVDQLGLPSQRGANSDWVSNTWLFRQGQQGPLPFRCDSTHDKYVDCGAPCSRMGSFSRGEYGEILKELRSRGQFDTCPIFDLYVHIKLSGLREGGRFNRITISIADHLAASEAYQADQAFVQQAKSMLVPNPNGYKP